MAQVNMEQGERRKWALLLGALTSLGPLAIDAYLPALPTIERELGSSPGAVQLTLSAYFLGLASGQLLWGPIADRRGRRNPLLMGLALYATGSLLCAIAPRVEVLIAARGIQALGGSAGVVVVRAVVRDRWAGRQAAQMMSLIVLVMGAAPILAPTLGGALLGLGSWRLIFVLLFVAALLVLLAIHRFLPETGGGRTPERLLDAARHAIQDRRFVAYSLAAGFSQAGMFAYIAGSPFVFIEILGLDPSVFAILFGVNATGYIACSQLNAFLLRTRDHTTVALAGTVATTTIGSALLWITAGAAALIPIAALVLAYVASIGFVNANSTAAALEDQQERAGLASALMGSAQFTIASVASALVGALADGTSRPMAIVMVGCAAVALACVLVGRTTVAHSAEARPA